MPLAVMDGAVLTGLRTGAATAVSVKHMAPEYVNKVAMIGAGFQANYQVRAVAAVKPFKELAIHDKVFEKAVKLAEKFFEYFKRAVNVKAVESPDEAVEGAQVIVTATTSLTPVVLGRWLKPPAHVSAIGSYLPTARELDDDVVRMAEVVAVDSREACKRETGDVIIPLREGVINEGALIEIGEVVAGLRPGRVSDGVTVFKSVGLAVQDLAAANLAYRSALRRGKGVWVEL